MTELEDLKSFVEVVESGGFSRAAARLGVSKSIVSRRIARLEAELGARLLSRTTRGLSPTEAGLDFKTRAERRDSSAVAGPFSSTAETRGRSSSSMK